MKFRQSIIVTGASHGLGLSIASTLVEKGYWVLNLDKESPVESSVLNNCITYICDLEDFGALNLDLLVSLEKTYQLRISGLVNNAIPHHKQNNLVENFESIISMLNIGLIAPYLLIQSCAELIATRHTANAFSVVNISSSVVEAPSDESGSYHLAKGGLNALTKYSSIKFAKLGMRVNAIQPAFIVKNRDVEFFNSESNEAYRKIVQSLHPLGQVGSELDLANLVEFLISSNSRFINGQSISLNGGYGLSDPLKSILEIWDK